MTEDYMTQENQQSLDKHRAAFAEALRDPVKYNPDRPVYAGEDREMPEELAQRVEKGDPAADLFIDNYRKGVILERMYQEAKRQTAPVSTLALVQVPVASLIAGKPAA
ncbi:MAG: hypothetical protein JWM96_427 [Alphaproteobacteria bacterium]|nr:hypothetical protein [Alphaproteobacteria bacterium]